MRKIEQLDKKVIEDLMKESLEKVGIKDIKDETSNLLLRIFLSGISNHFFLNPDTEIDVGFLKFKKSPNLDELFTVEIIRDIEEGVVNAGAMYKYYTGGFTAEKKIKGLVENFVDELLFYSQEQNMKISGLTSKLSNTKGKKKK